MAYTCRTGIKTECDACGQCIKDVKQCPVCDCEEWDYLVKQGKEIVGCSECIERIWRYE